MSIADKLRRLKVLEMAAEKRQSTATAAIYTAFREGEPAPVSSVPVYELVTSKTEQ